MTLPFSVAPVTIPGVVEGRKINALSEMLRVGQSYPCEANDDLCELILETPLKLSREDSRHRARLVSSETRSAYPFRCGQKRPRN